MEESNVVSGGRRRRNPSTVSKCGLLMAKWRCGRFGDAPSSTKRALPQSRTVREHGKCARAATIGVRVLLWLSPQRLSSLGLLLSTRHRIASRVRRLRILTSDSTDIQRIEARCHGSGPIACQQNGHSAGGSRNTVPGLPWGCPSRTHRLLWPCIPC